MDSTYEIRIMQKRMLINLKMVNKNPGLLKQLITMAEAEMDQEDVAYVEKKIEEMKI